MADSYDVAIAGAGPAGCSAAILLAGAGARVVLLEAGSYPRDKVCGAFLSPEGGAQLAALGVMPLLRPLGPVPIATVRITAPDGAERTIPLPGAALGISRSALDAALARRAREAGAEVREGSPVTGIRGDVKNGFRLETRAAAGRSEVRARSVIAAHGKRDALDRALRRRFLARRQPFVALQNHFHGPPLPGRVELHSFPGGYCGMSEIEGGAANVCLLVRRPIVARRGIPAFLEWMQSHNPRLREWLSRAEAARERWLGIAEVPFVVKGPLEGEILMAGDAAAVIAPLAGDGIAMALRSGCLAAERTAEFLSGKASPVQLRRRYARDWRREFAGRLRLSRALQSLMLRPALLSPALRIAGAFPSVGELLVARTRDCSRAEEAS